MERKSGGKSEIKKRRALVTAYLGTVALGADDPVDTPTACGSTKRRNGVSPAFGGANNWSDTRIAQPQQASDWTVNFSDHRPGDASDGGLRARTSLI